MLRIEELPRWFLLFLLICCDVAWSDTEPTEVAEDHAARMQEGLQLFRTTVRAALIQHCLECHGGQATKADFSLAKRDSLMNSGFVESQASESLLLRLIRHEDEPAMPFKKPKLADHTIEQIARWIDLGAPYDKPLVETATSGEQVMRITDADRRFWSFQPLQIVAPPRVEHPRTARTTIDFFVLHKLDQRNITPNSQADRRTLIRRAYLDLLGLPPSPREVEAFVNDSNPRAYDSLIDRLLASNHYGERWARHWMDVARFAESSGFEHDSDRPTAYHYRDFLIEAFNADVPWDQMVRWQLAGDELHPESPLAMKATGFLGAGVFPTQLTEAEFESARYDELDDIVGTLGVAFLGLTTGCARCHDHKYDPIPTRDYYELAANFATVIRSEALVSVDPATHQQQYAIWSKRHHVLQQAVANSTGDAKQEKQREVEQHQLLKPQAGTAWGLICSEGVKPLKHHADGRGYPHFYPQVHYLARGDVKQKTGEAEPGFLQVLIKPGNANPAPHGEPRGTRDNLSYRRTALAHRLTDPQDGAGHLLARVIVNRLWQHHFGRGIVATPNDFGIQGARPTHPELLDWLANDLIRHGWRLKPLHKRIMTSAVYMRSAADDPSSAEHDLENTWLWRYQPRRLEAEAIRDSLLMVSGQMDPAMYGPGSLDEGMRRRSIYFTIKRSRFVPLMQVFDWPEHLVSIGRRATTTTAPQALALMNNRHVRHDAEAFAARVRASRDMTLEAAVSRAYDWALSRPPTNGELHRALAFLETQSEQYSSSTHAAEQRALADFCQALMSSNEFLYLP